MPLLLLMVTLLLTGCATTQLPVAEPSHAWPAQASALGRLVEAEARQHPAGHSGFVLLAESQEAFDARARLIHAARRSLDLQYYIVEEGLTTRLLLDELLQAADRGVRVRVLLDDTVTDGRDDWFAALASHPNVQVRVFNPVLRGRSLRFTRLLARLAHLPRQHRRMHNKVLLADSSLAIVGGRNLGDEYFAADRRANFADMDLLAAGPVAGQLATSFDQYWNHRLSIPIDLLQTSPPPADALATLRATLADELAQAATEQPKRFQALTAYRARDPVAALLGPLQWAPGQAMWDNPDKVLYRGRPPMRLLLANALIEALRQVDRELMLVSAYFVPTADGVALLTERVAAGAEVRILTNSLEATDVPAVHGGYAPYREALLAQGVELYELRPDPNRGHGEYRFTASSESSLHSKAMVLDRERAFVGSPNFDPRSVFWNTEVGILVDSPELAGQVRALIAEGMQLAVSYRVEQRVHDGHSSLIWVTEEDGERRVHTREPGGLWRRFTAWMADVMGVEPLL